MSIKSIFPLKIRSAAYRVLAYFKRLVAIIIRNIPLVSSFLNLPKGRIRSIKSYIENQRAKVSWSVRMHRPLYFCLQEPMIYTPNEPLRFSTTCQTVLYPINEPLNHFHYWLKGSGFDSTSGFGKKFLVKYDEVFFCYLPNARVIGPSGAVLTSKGFLVEESLWSWDKWIKNDRSMISWRLPKGNKIEVPCFLLNSNDSIGYPHWLMEGLPRLYALLKLPKNLRPVILASFKLSSWHKETIKLLGFEGYEVMEIEDKVYQINELIFPSYAGMPGTPHPVLCKWVVQKMKSHFEISSSRTRFYITRRLAKRRLVINEDEIIEILNEFNFTIVEAEKLSVSDQIQLFSNAEAIVSPHGAGLANIMFAPEGSKVFEILDKDYVNDHYYNLACIFNLQYYYQLCNSVSFEKGLPANRPFDDIKIDPIVFRKTLEMMFRI